MEISLAAKHNVPMPIMESDGPSYPSVYLSFSDEDPELPKEGVMTVRFCVRRKSVEASRGKVSVEYSVELKDIVAVKAEKSEKKNGKLPSAEEALDKLRKEYEEESEDEEEDEKEDED